MPKSGIFGLKFKDFYQTTILQQTLQEDKFEDADFKYDNNIYQLLARKYGNLTFLVPNLRIFIFCRKLCNKANSWVLISNTTIVFQNCCRKHLNVASFGSRFKNPNFCTKLCNQTIWRVFIRNMTIVFQHSSQRPKQSIFVPKFFFFSFWRKHYSFTNSSVLIRNLIIVFVILQPKNT